MNIPGISDLGSWQTLVSWSRKSHPSWKSLQLLPYTDISVSSRKILLVVLDSWQLLSSWCFWVCKNSNLRVAAQLSPFSMHDSSSWEQLLLFNCTWIHPSALLLPAPCLKLRDGDDVFTARLLRTKSRANVFCGNVDKNCCIVTFLLNVPKQTCCLFPSGIVKNGKKPWYSPVIPLAECAPWGRSLLCCRQPSWVGKLTTSLFWFSSLKDWLELSMAAFFLPSVFTLSRKPRPTRSHGTALSSPDVVISYGQSTLWTQEQLLHEGSVKNIDWALLT